MPKWSKARRREASWRLFCGPSWSSPPSRIRARSVGLTWGPGASRPQEPAPSRHALGITPSVVRDQSLEWPCPYQKTILGEDSADHRCNFHSPTRRSWLLLRPRLLALFVGLICRQRAWSRGLANEASLPFGASLLTTPSLSCLGGCAFIPPPPLIPQCREEARVAWCGLARRCRQGLAPKASQLDVAREESRPTGPTRRGHRLRGDIARDPGTIWARDEDFQRAHLETAAACKEVRLTFLP